MAKKEKATKVASSKEVKNVKNIQVSNEIAKANEVAKVDNEKEVQTYFAKANEVAKVSFNSSLPQSIGADLQKYRNSVFGIVRDVINDVSACGMDSKYLKDIFIAHYGENVTTITKDKKVAAESAKTFALAKWDTFQNLDDVGALVALLKSKNNTINYLKNTLPSFWLVDEVSGEEKHYFAKRVKVFTPSEGMGYTKRKEYEDSDKFTEVAINIDGADVLGYFVTAYIDILEKLDVQILQRWFVGGSDEISTLLSFDSKKNGYILVADNNVNFRALVPALSRYMYTDSRAKYADDVERIKKDTKERKRKGNIENALSLLVGGIAKELKADEIEPLFKNLAKWCESKEFISLLVGIDFTQESAENIASKYFKTESEK